MNISIVLTTARLGGLDIIYHSLQRQTFSGDFELVLVDELYSNRAVKMIDSGKFKDARFKINHMPSRRKSSIYDDTLGYNTGIVKARGELIVFLIDYLWVPADYLERHWRVYKEKPGWTASCYMDRYIPPVIKRPPYSAEQDWWSLFLEDFTAEYAEKFFTNNEPVYRERRGCRGKVHDDGTVEIPGDFAYMVGESIPMAILTELNGWDERFCGGYGSNDVDLGMRVNHIGHKFVLNHGIMLKKLTLSNVTQIPGMSKRKIRTPEDNYRFFEARRIAIAGGKESARTPSGWGLE